MSKGKKTKSGNPAKQGGGVHAASVGLSALTPGTISALNEVTVRIKAHAQKKKNETAFVLKVAELNSSGDKDGLVMLILTELFGPFNEELAELLPTLPEYQAFMTDAVERDSFGLGLKK